MKFLPALILFLHFPLAQAKVVATYTYLKAQKPVQKSIHVEELKNAYEIIKRSTFSPPAPEKFFEDYLRFKMGVEIGLNERRLVKTADIGKYISSPYLKQAFEQQVYTHLAEMKLKKQTAKLDKASASLSDKALKSLYAKNPEFNIFFISVHHPINPSKAQIREAGKRAKQIHSQVLKSKKPFLELVALYSDDKSNGTLGINRSSASIFPEVYAQLKKMKNNSISRPVRVANGYVIAKLNRKVPFAEANKIEIRANHFNRLRTKAFNNYFNGLKKDFKINIVNKALVKTL